MQTTFQAANRNITEGHSNILHRLNVGYSLHTHTHTHTHTAEIRQFFHFTMQLESSVT